MSDSVGLILEEGLFLTARFPFGGIYGKTASTAVSTRDASVPAALVDVVQASYIANDAA